MTQTDTSSSKPTTSPTTKFVIISGVMFVFISYWRVAAVVLCDLASTAFYIGGIVEHSIGPAAPWFIVTVMLFSYAVRSVYIESCSMFVRGGVYRIVKEALGRTLAKIAVAALLFDYVLTGPISGVSAGQYLMSLFFEFLTHTTNFTISHQEREFFKSAGSVVIALGITIYFFRLNVIGIHESSDKAVKIMIVTTVMGVMIIGWSLFTLAIEGPKNELTFQPDFTAKVNPATGQHESPLGFLEGTAFGNTLTDGGHAELNHKPVDEGGTAIVKSRASGWHWFSLVGVIGIFIAFGHSVLAMSGEETLAQIYREVEAPKLKNFKRAAFIVFIYSLVLTGGISVLAVVLIPEDIRMTRYSDNLIGGLAMHVYGPPFARLLLNAFVVIVGSLILAGAVNTAIIGSNGVLNRVGEDGVIPDWFLKPHPRFGTSYRLLYLIVGLQVFTILISHGDVLLLGEAYAFGVVWSFVFNCLAMLVLRFRDPDRPRGFKVPLNFKIGKTEVPVGLGCIFLILLISAVTNVLTKEVATEAGLCFTVVLFLLFMGTEYYRNRQSGGKDREHLDEFNEIMTDSVTPETLKLKHQMRKVVAIRSTAHLDPLDKALEESDSNTTDIIPMTVNVRPTGGVVAEHVPIGIYDQELINAIEKRAETAGKTVVPIIVSTNNMLHAVMQTVQSVGAQELLLGVSERFTPNQQLDRCAAYWERLHAGHSTPLTIRIIGPNRDFFAHIGDGHRITRDARHPDDSRDEMPETDKLVDNVLFVHDGTSNSASFLREFLSVLNQNVRVRVVALNTVKNDHWKKDVQEAQTGGRQIEALDLPAKANFSDEFVKLIRKEGIDFIVSSALFDDLRRDEHSAIRTWTEKVLKSTDCRIILAAAPLMNETTNNSHESI